MSSPATPPTSCIIWQARTQRSIARPRRSVTCRRQRADRRRLLASVRLQGRGGRREHGRGRRRGGEGTLTKLLVLAEKRILPASLYDTPRGLGHPPQRGNLVRHNPSEHTLTRTTGCRRETLHEQPWRRWAACRPQAEVLRVLALPHHDPLPLPRPPAAVCAADDVSAACRLKIALCSPAHPS
jgi:hypothetical protein